MPDATPLYFEDLTEGRTFRTGRVAVDLAAVRDFAAAYDPQPFHLDEGLAVASLFGGLVASGWQTAALTMRMLVDGDLKVAGGLIGVGVDSIRWPRPVRPGDVLRVESVVLESRPSASKPDRGIVRLRSITYNQDDREVMEQVASLVVPRRPA